MIRPYLSDIINDHKTQGKWIIHSGDKVIESENPERMEDSINNGN